MLRQNRRVLSHGKKNENNDAAMNINKKYNQKIIYQNNDNAQNCCNTTISLYECN